MTWYVDFLAGNADVDGSSPERAARTPETLHPKAGDEVLFRRGGFWRGMIDTVEGVAYGAYGEGPAPVISGGVDLSSPAQWERVGEKLWSCVTPPDSETGNFIFNGDECTAALHWNEEELTEQGDFWDSAFGTGNFPELADPFEKHRLLLVSEKNPGEFYSHIEAAVYGKRRLAMLKSGVTLQDLEFRDHGVHGATAEGAENVTIRRCRFLHIGGCPWNKKLRIRFGNAVEFWDWANDVTVEDCEFRDVYDSCATFQGSAACVPCRRFLCRRNRFDSYGMAAFEYRDRLPVDSEFSENVCLNAGCGFAMAGETLPRKSEIWPQPMGHHIFLWRIEAPSEGGSLRIHDNDFGAAPNGAAVYSIISPEAEKQISLKGNRYDPRVLMTARWNGETCTDAEKFSQVRSGGI